MNIDCQIRGKSDIHEALSTMCEVELMEGDNKVYCDRCKRNTDTILRTAISNLPDMLVLSLKRFDLDYNTFETVKLNSRCAFGERLNMKRYTLEGSEAMENAGVGDEETGEDGDVVMRPIDEVGQKTDEDYEYNLVGVLVHAGVAQGGHYYSFIKDRSSKLENGTWYRFDDEDVTVFDPANIELECFGGKVRQEKKFMNGQVQTVESEQFANALMLFYEKVTPNELNVNEDEKTKENAPLDKNKKQLSMSSGYDVFQPDVSRSNKAHSWHTFLFDSEFQSFLKGLLGLCLISNDSTTKLIDAMEVSSPSSSSSKDETRTTWPSAILQMSLNYFFEILLHSADSSILRDWVKKLSSALQHDRSGARWFVHELTKRSTGISSNWLRIFFAECPEEFSRNAAVQVISAAIASCISFSDEQMALKAWTDAWQHQIDSHGTGAIPTTLSGKFARHEDLVGLGDNSSSSIGIILSYLSLLLEYAPRTWRYNNELCLLIRNISSIRSEVGGALVRQALATAQVPARLICLAIREKAPSTLQNCFQGASISHSVAEAIVRNETPSPHLLNLDSGAVGMSTTTGHSNTTSTIPSPADYMNLLEAIGCIIGVPGGKRAILVEDTEEFTKGRSTITLSGPAREALSIIFTESKSSSSGMGQRDLENYMYQCGVESNSLHLQSKITSILNKYQTTKAFDKETSKNVRYLTLDGFLNYHRDTIQTNEVQVSFEYVEACVLF